MTQPYDYRIRPVDVGNYFDAFRQGRAERREAEAETRSDSLRQYLGPAYQGDEAAQQEVFKLDPEAGMRVQAAIRQQSDADLQRNLKLWDLGGAILRNVKPGDVEGFERAKFSLREIGVPSQFVDSIQPEQVPLLVQFSPTAQQQITAELDRRAKEASIRQSNAAADASRANADFIRSGKGAGTFRPLPQRLQGSENEWLEKAQIASNNNADVATYIGKIDAGEFDPGVLKNRYEQAKSFFGVVDPNDVNARNYNVFLSTMERLRNESLRLNKGVQTEGDAQRAWNELFQNINDKTVVRDQLARIAALNERAARQMLALARNQRKSFFGRAYEEPDWSELGVNPSFLEAPREPVTSFTRGGAGVFSDSLGGSAPPPTIRPNALARSPSAGGGSQLREGQTGTSRSGRPMVVRNGQWEYQ